MTLILTALLMVLPLVGMVPAHLKASAVPVQTGERYDYR